MPSVIYPTNQYTTVNLQVNNIDEFREKREKPIIDATTGEALLENPTRTLYDVMSLSMSDTSDFLWVLGGGSSNEITALIDAIKSLTPKQRDYFTKLKQAKILIITDRARKMAYDLQRLRAELMEEGSHDIQHIPAAQESPYPSSQTFRSFLNR